MKAIKDCEWKVRIIDSSGYSKNNGYFWEADSKTNPLLYDLVMPGYAASDRSARRNWLRFAKVNGIKRFKFV